MFLKGTLHFIEQRTTARKGKKTFKARMMNTMISFLPDLHYTAAPCVRGLEL